MPQPSKKLPKLPKELLNKIQSQQDVDYETVLKLNAALLDCLFRLSLTELDKDKLDLLQSRLRLTPAFVESYILFMWKKLYERTNLE